MEDYKRRELAVLKDSKNSSEDTLDALVICDYKPLRPGELSVKADEEVKVQYVNNGYAFVKTNNNREGIVPSYFLDINNLDGETLVDQILYRRYWYEKLAEVDLNGISLNPLSKPSSDGNSVMAENNKFQKLRQTAEPVVTKNLTDMVVREGEKVVFEPEIISPVDFSVVWRGPAVEKKRAQIENNGMSTRLIIGAADFLDAGPYSVVAQNEFGSTSTVALLKVLKRPEPPSSLSFTRTGWRSIRLTWKASPTQGVRYCIQFKRPDMPSFQSVTSDLKATKVSLRQFRASTYHIRVFAYNLHYRTTYTNEVVVDFSLEAETSDVLTQFSFGSVLGCGRTSITYNVFDGTQTSVMAGKVFSKKRSFKDIEREVAILHQLAHPNIPQFHFFYESEKGYCLLMQRIPGMDIASYVEQLGYLTEDVLQLLCRYIFEILSYIHDQGIIYTDMKTDNLLVDYRVVLIDYGTAQKKETITETSNSSISGNKKDKLASENPFWRDADNTFSAPERSAGLPPSEKTDVWSVGSIICHLCFGEPPHRAAYALKKAKDRFSIELIDFLNKLLVRDPSKRMSASEALKHEWMREILRTNLPKIGEKEMIPDDIYLVVEKSNRLSRSASFDWS